MIENELRQTQKTKKKYPKFNKYTISLMIDSIEYPDVLNTVQHYNHSSPEHTNLFKLLQNQQKIERSPMNSNFSLMNCKENNPMADNVSSNENVFKRFRNFDQWGSMTKNKDKVEFMAEEKEDIGKIWSKKQKQRSMGDRFIPLR